MEGRARHDGARTGEAIAELDHAVRLQPTDPKFRLSLANILAGSGKLDEAIAQYQAGLRVAPTSTRLLGGLALALAANGKMNESLETFGRALLDPQNRILQKDYAATLASSRRLHGQP